MTKSAVDALLDTAGLQPSPGNGSTAGADLPPLPATKGEVGKLSAEQMDVLVEAHGLAVGSDWHDASTPERHKILNVLLGFVAAKKGKGTAVKLVVDGKPEALPPVTADILEDEPEGKVLVAQPVAAPAKPKKGTEVATMDPLTQAAHEIEQLKDQGSIEGEIGTLLSTEGLNDFRLGGLLLRLMEVGVFADSASFKTYVEAKWGLKYRKARYMIELYNGLVNSGVAWEVVAGIGWSKIITLLPILTPENAAEWVEKAHQYTNDTLHAAVQAATASGEVAPTNATLEASKMKTLTFPAAPDQEEIILEAIETAMKAGNTTHKGVALELICTDYLGNTPGMKAKAAQQQLIPATALEEAYQPKAIFTHFLTQAGGSIPDALTALFSDAFDEVFPGVEVELKIKAG